MKGHLKLLFLMLLIVTAFGQNKQTKSTAINQRIFPSDIECEVKQYYRQRPDGKPGREITISFKDAKLTGSAQVEVTVNGRSEITNVPAIVAVSYTHLRAHETRHDLVCRLLLEKKK